LEKSVPRILVDNNLALQKKSIALIESVNDLSKKVDKLSTRIDKLLNVFEEASKHVMEAGEDRRVIELADKLEELLEQNRTLTKGLLMLESYVRSKTQFEKHL